jgi:hypothetical protein
MGQTLSGQQQGEVVEEERLVAPGLGLTATITRSTRTIAASSSSSSISRATTTVEAATMVGAMVATSSCLQQARHQTTTATSAGNQGIGGCSCHTIPYVSCPCLRRPG